MPPPFQCFSGDCFGKTIIVNVSGIHKIDSMLEAAVHHPNGVSLGHLTAEGHRAYGESGHFEVGFAESFEFHGSPLIG
jgi:hypothetical protein